MMAIRRGHATGLEADGAQLVLRRQQVRNRPQMEPQVGVLLVQMRLGGCLREWARRDRALFLWTRRRPPLLCAWLARMGRGRDHLVWSSHRRSVALAFGLVEWRTTRPARA
ncbi:hypothetical protein MTO96_007606 [Rhipicephalus appendiculatus]